MPLPLSSFPPVWHLGLYVSSRLNTLIDDNEPLYTARQAAHTSLTVRPSFFVMVKGISYSLIGAWSHLRYYDPFASLSRCPAFTSKEYIYANGSPLAATTTMKLLAVFVFVTYTTAFPQPKRAADADIHLQNGKDAVALKYVEYSLSAAFVDNEVCSKEFKSLSPDSSCNDGETACVSSSFAQCDHGKFILTECSPSLM